MSLRIGNVVSSPREEMNAQKKVISRERYNQQLGYDTTLDTLGFGNLLDRCADRLGSMYLYVCADY